MTPSPQQHEWWCCEDCEHDGQGTCPVPEIKTIPDLKKFQAIVKVTGCKHQKSTRSRPSPAPTECDPQDEGGFLGKPVYFGKFVTDSWLKDHDAVIVAATQEAESLRWATAFNTLIATESKRTSKESVDMVYSYRIAQIIESLRSTPSAPEQEDRQ